MATYQELIDMLGTGGKETLLKKVSVAVTVKAKDILDEPTPTSQELEWASKALMDTPSQAEKLLKYVLAKNIGSTVNQILTVTDSVLQNNVNAAVDKLIAGGII